VSNSQAVRTRHPKSTTRANILAKAYQMYLAEELEHGDERLSTVLESLGYTTGAGYQIWANQAAFREDLKVYIAENIEYASLRAMAEKVSELAARNLPFEQHVLTAADQYIEVYLSQDDFYLTLRFFAMSDRRPAAVTEAMIGAYERSSWEAAELFANVFARFKRRIRSGLEMEDVTAAVTALIEGYALRARVDRTKVDKCVEVDGRPHRAFSLAFLGLIKELSEPLPESLEG
jgi:hypothetical protein